MKYPLFKKLRRQKAPRRIVGQKLPLKIDQIWAIRVRLELHNKLRDLALFDMAMAG